VDSRPVTGQDRRFIAVVEDLVERHFECAGEFFQRFDGGHRMSVFDARDIATQ
jgi:hypothetical protein